MKFLKQKLLYLVQISLIIDPISLINNEAVLV